jgi:alkanesulfonate monooxygenase SsuD/methylene tetrahydromethanopterin reductase-like flavin-dependent oxidoreductase (luciferase family)
VRIAEDFRLLQLFYGDRMDLGIAAAIVADPVGSALLDGRNSANMPRFADKLADLKALVSPPTGTLGPAIQLGPGFHTPNSEFWMCGGGERLATLAGNLGMRFAFHHYFHQSRQATASGPAIVSQYRSAFSASSSTERPYVAVACYGICADVETDAEHLWHANFGAQETVPDPCFSGTPADCISRLRAIRLAYGADEIVVQSLTPDFHARLRSYQLLADGISK